MTARLDDDDEFGGTFASPPCLMHELDPTFAGLVIDPVAARDVARWRKAERERLIAARLAISAGERAEHARCIALELDEIIARQSVSIISVYWPFRGEPDLRPWMHALSARGMRVALPVVVGRLMPLIFREWRPDAKLARGTWNIPFPEDGTIVEPDVVIAPLVGFDGALYRLGYGGGYFDRTLAALAPRPLVVGVGYPTGAIPTIYPQPHDIPMDRIVTGMLPRACGPSTGASTS